MEILGTLLKILAAIFVFGIIILVHELGHFFVAKLMGVKVNEFAIGMGPTLLRFGKKETKYSLRAFPIGGFCAMEGEDSESPDPRSFGSKKVWRRLLIIIAGAVMNLLLGFVLLLIAFGLLITPNSNGEYKFATTTIQSVVETSPAYTAGLRAGDTILSIDGKRIMTTSDISMIMQSDEDGIFDMVVRREVDGKKKKVTLDDVGFTLKKDEESGQRYLEYSFYVKGVKRNVFNTITQAAKMEYSVATMIWRSLGDILTGKYGLNDLSGPVGTVSAIGDAVEGVVTQPDIREGLYTLFMLVVIITVNVGIFNLLPLPALDGGRLIFLIYEGLFRHPVKPKYEGLVHAIGLILLFGLMILVTFSDIARLIKGS